MIFHHTSSSLNHFCYVSPRTSINLRGHQTICTYSMPQNSPPQPPPLPPRGKLRETQPLVPSSTWPYRLLHTPTMTSHAREGLNTYNGVVAPEYNVISYTWGNFVDPTATALSVAGIDWPVPSWERGISHRILSQPPSNTLPEALSTPANGSGLTLLAYHSIIKTKQKHREPCGARRSEDRWKSSAARGKHSLGFLTCIRTKSRIDGL